MKYPHFIFSILFIAFTFVWWGCSASTTTTTAAPVTLTRTLTIPSAIDFGNTRLGVCADSLLGAPRDSTVTMVNTGNDTVRIHSVTPQSPVFSVIAHDSIIAPAGSGSLRLSFCPSQPGIASGTMIISSNATQDSNQTITLTGNGVPYSPGLGSIYTYTAVKLDTAGKTVGSPFSASDTIIATGLTYQDSTNVTETSDSTYFIIESDGDAGIYAVGFPAYPPATVYGSGWQTLPFVTHGQNIQILSDDQTYNDSTGEPVTLNIRDSASYVGSSQTMIGNVTAQESHVHLVESALYTASRGTITVRIVLEVYFSPDLGTIVSQTKVTKEVITSGKTREPATGGGEERTLVSFQAH